MIYFLRIDSGERVGTTKVGTSVTPGDRVAAIVDSIRCAATLHAVEPGGLPEERAAHEVLDRYRVMFGGQREHFQTSAVLEYIGHRKVRVLDLPYRCGCDSQLAALHAFDVAILRKTAEMARRKLASYSDGKATVRVKRFIFRNLMRLEKAEFRLAKSSGTETPRIRAVIARCEAMMLINAGNVYGERAKSTLVEKLVQLPEAERRDAEARSRLKADTTKEATT